MAESNNEQEFLDAVIARLSDPDNALAKAASEAFGEYTRRMILDDWTGYACDDAITEPLPGTEDIEELDYLCGIGDYTYDCGGGCVG